MPTDPLRIVVLDGDETGQELLDQALRVLDKRVVGLDVQFERYDLYLENRRATQNSVISAAAQAARQAGLGLFGSIAGAESMIMAFDSEYNVQVAMAEGPHGTAPTLLGKNSANLITMISPRAHCSPRLECGATTAPSVRRRRSTTPSSRRPRPASGPPTWAATRA